MDFQTYLSKGMTYAQFLALVDNLHTQNKVTGNTQSDELMHYSQLNRKRIDRIMKTAQIQADTLAELRSAIKSPMVWLTITEGWCGDAAQIIPFIEVMAQALPDLVEHKLVLRDENPELIDQFLTNGGRAIPKFIFLDAQSGELLGHWGPRPAAAQAIMNEYKAAVQGMDEAEKHKRHEQANTQLHTWYAHNKGIEIQREFAQAVLSAAQVVLPA